MIGEAWISIYSDSWAQVINYDSVHYFIPGSTCNSHTSKITQGKWLKNKVKNISESLSEN